MMQFLVSHSLSWMDLSHQLTAPIYMEGCIFLYWALAPHRLDMKILPDLSDHLHLYWEKWMSSPRTHSSPLSTHILNLFSHSYTHLYRYVKTPIWTHTHTYIYIYIYLWSIHNYINSTHTHEYIHTHTHTHTYIYIYPHSYVYWSCQLRLQNTPTVSWQRSKTPHQ